MFQENMIEDGDRTDLWKRRAFETSPLLREFPAKTNILIVDTHFMSLLDMKEIMEQYNYQVTVYTDAEDALSFLKNCKHEINLVLWDFHMPVINGIQALKIIGSEMDLPVTESVMQATIHGASDYVMKPVGEEVISIIWKHIIKKIVMSKPGLIQSIQSNPVQIGGLQGEVNPNINKKQEKIPQIPIPVQTIGLDRDNEGSTTMNLNINKRQEKMPQISVQTIGLDRDNEGSSTMNPVHINKKQEKRPQIQSDPVQTIDNEGSKTTNQDHINEQKMDKREEKKPRIMWTIDLQQKFLKAIDIVGGAEKANPKILLKIMQDMHVEGLTRQNVSSHLQKHRMCLEEARISQEQREINRSIAYRSHLPLNPNNVQTTIPSYNNLIKDGDIMTNMFQQNQYSNVFLTTTQLPLPYLDHQHHHHHHHLHQQLQSSTTIPQPHFPYLDHHHHHHHHDHQQPSSSSTAIPQPHLPFLDHHHHHNLHQQPSSSTIAIPKSHLQYLDHHHHHLHQQPSPTSTTIPQPHLPNLDHDHHHHNLHQQPSSSSSTDIPQQQSPSPLESTTATSQPHLHQNQEQEQSNFQLSDNVMIKNEPENDFGIDEMNPELIYPALPYDPKEFLVD